MNRVPSRFKEGTVSLRDLKLHCSVCDIEINEDWDFCMKCGTLLSNVSLQPVNSHLIDCYEKWYRRCNL